jgi:hypothetical protein
MLIDAYVWIFDCAEGFEMVAEVDRGPRGEVHDSGWLLSGPHNVRWSGSADFASFPKSTPSIFSTFCTIHEYKGHRDSTSHL